MKVYIRSAACISPQKTFGDVPFLTDVIEYNGNRLRAIDPDYTTLIEYKSLRRMSQIIKMGVAAALECLNTSNITIPGAIITGTAYGCIEDTVTFLTRIIELNEELLPPTPFIQSTHNTVAAQIALILKCHNYNNTFVHKGISFESALLDAMMLLRENEADNILVGGTDEMTDVSFTILSRLGLYKRWPISNLDVLTSNTKGTIGGEGATFFLLTDKKSQDNVAEMTDLITFYKPNDEAEIETRILAFLAQNSLQQADIDLVLMGKNGDLKNDNVYNKLTSSLFHKNSLANYKHLCGDYPTSISFALWVATNMIKHQVIPEIVIEAAKTDQHKTDQDKSNYDKTNPAKKDQNWKGGELKRILIYNHYQYSYHSLMIVSAC